MLNFKFIGWCHEGTHDKVWGAIKLNDGKVLTFWGRRGKKLQTKLAADNWDLRKLIDSKENKGYVSVDQHKLNQVYPEFENDLEKTAMWAILCS
jgi:predicted DNA-binding WGR domain protein